MRKVAILGATIGMFVVSPASARQTWRAIPKAHATVAQPACPAGVPVQTITVIKQANVSPVNLALVERAAVDQSIQLRRWWNTPCIQFGPGGWKLYLKQGAFASTSGEHFWNGSPYILMWTGALNYEMWSSVFTHEIVETLVDPQNTYYNASTSSSSYQLEVADPVELQTYRLDSVNVSDFVTPNWYAGATTGPCETDVIAGNPVVNCPGPLLAPASNAGPWDQARALRGPWQVYGRNR